jgi:hypothetical protein
VKARTPVSAALIVIIVSLPPANRRAWRQALAISLEFLLFARARRAGVIDND